MVIAWAAAVPVASVNTFRANSEDRMDERLITYFLSRNFFSWDTE
jgi:hypothetical protein